MTNDEALKKTVRCAVALRNMGLQIGDVIVLMVPNHVDSVIPFYAALYLGVIIAPIHMTFANSEYLEEV